MNMLLLLQMLGLSAAMAMAASAAQGINALPGCKQKCGDVTIPYPFGIGKGCFLEEGFNITCNASSSPPTPLLGETNIDVVEIQLSQGLVVVNQYMAYDCYDKVGNSTRSYQPYLDLTDMPYKLSDSRNKFFAVGCDTLGYFYNDQSDFWTGCMSVCNSTRHIPNGTCSGIGCCEAPIPKGLLAFDVVIDSFFNHTNCWGFDPCSYAFLTDTQGWFNFSLDSFSSLANMTDVPVTLDWAIGNQTCEEAQSNFTSFACKSDNSICLNSTNGPGYRCNCSKGFQGNPYLQGGCQDINECAVLLLLLLLHQHARKLLLLLSPGHVW